MLDYLYGPVELENGGGVWGGVDGGAEEPQPPPQEDEAQHVQRVPTTLTSYILPSVQ